MANIKHNMYGTPTYKSWANMKYRCGKGCWKNITYCDRWEKFENFYEDMGVRPENTTLDRINVNGNYEPSNCRWADDETQQNNKTSCKYYCIDNKRLTLAQIARKYKVSRSNLANKIYIYKMSMKEALDYLKGLEGLTYRTKKNVRQNNY